MLYLAIYITAVLMLIFISAQGFEMFNLLVLYKADRLADNLLR